MQRSIFKQTLFLVITFIAASTFFSFISKPGGDVYEIHLNNKLVLKQFVYKPLPFKALSLTNANANDQLTVYYSHCGVTGKGRSITVKDSKGNTLKKWNFTDAKGNTKGMTIAVKELLQLEKKNANGSLSLTYAAKELPEGRMLTSLQFAQKNTAYHFNKEAIPVFTAGNVLKVAL
jgi:hypothetical protein